MTPNQQANELMTLLEQFNTFNFNGLTAYTLCGSPVDGNRRPGRTGLSDTNGLCDSGYRHFYFFIDGWLIYFSKTSIKVRIEEEHNQGSDEVFNGTIDDFLLEYFQLSTQYDLISRSIFVRIKNFMSTYNWVKV